MRFAPVRLPSSLLLVASGFLFLDPTFAQETKNPEANLRGAKALLAEWQIPPHENPGEADFPTSHRFRDELAVYVQTVSTLEPAQAARRWLELWDTYLRRASSTGSMLLRQPEILPDFDKIVAALPPVSAWPDLAKLINERPFDPKTAKQTDFALRLLAARISDNRAAEEVRFAEIKEFLARPSKDKDPNLFSLLHMALNDPTAVEKNFLAAIGGYRKHSAHSNAPEQSLSIPNLVLLLGPDKARPLLTKAILSPFEHFSFSDEGKTLELAGEIASGMLEQMPYPHWELANRLGSPALFEALSQKFGEPKLSPPGPLRTDGPRESDMYSKNEYTHALGYHLLNLIMAGRESEAAALAVGPIASDQLSSSLLSSGANLLTRKGRAPEVAHFLHALLKDRPNLPYWDVYIEAAAHSGESAECLKMLQQAVDSPTLAGAPKIRMEERLANAFLADDQVDAGAAELQKIIAQPSQGTGPEIGHHDSQRRAAQAFLRLASALHREDWTNSAIDSLKKISSEESPDGEARMPVDELIEAHRLVEAETAIDTEVKNEIKRMSSSGYSSIGYSTSSNVVKLVQVYFSTRRYDDVLLVLRECPFIGASDLRRVSRYDSKDSPLLIAATALIETGAKDRALPLVECALAQQPGHDPAYALLLRIAPPDLETRLDALAKSDPFEERPLIWKAEYLRRAKRWAEAEAACRAAIVIDPSDGEQPAGDRLRVYSILSDVREALGDHAQAETYRAVVKAIRTAEEADTLYHAGLLKRAIEVYRKALNSFSDAYCIQSRLAVRLGEEGKIVEAEEHFKRAYELMPDSFGRVESHCFGCEKAFGPDRAQRIAEKVFGQMSEAPSPKPQVYYLLGYLRTEQDRPADALPNFRKATALDPDYLNAWKKLAEVSRELGLPSAERDGIASNILRLDPHGKHVSASVEDFRDLRTLFRLSETTTAARTPPGKVFPLPAAAAFLRKAAAEGESEEQVRDDDESPLTPDRLVGSVHFLQLVVGLGRPFNRYPE